VERTFSHYLFLVRGGQFTGSFREALEEHPHLIEKGKYYQNLKPYFDVFDEEQLLVTLFDDLKADDEDFIQSIYRFLNVSETITPQIDSANRLSAAKPRSRWLALMVKKGAHLMRFVGHPELISKIKYSGITNFLYKEYEKDEKPKICNKDRAFLEDQFFDDIEKLSAVLNKNIESLWLT